MLLVHKVTRVSDLNLSVVVQGPLRQSTDIRGFSTTCCVESVRRHHPSAEIVLSAWREELVSPALAAMVNRVVVSDDPGGLVIDRAGLKHGDNSNRLIRSTLAGVRAATREFCLKIRTDCLVVSNDLPSVPSDVPTCDSPDWTKIFFHPIYSRQFFTHRGLVEFCPYHFSDAVQFGRRANLLDYWGGGFLAESDFYFQGDHQLFFTPEQAIFLRFFRRVAPATLSSLPPRSSIEMLAPGVLDEYLRAVSALVDVHDLGCGVVLPRRMGVPFYNRPMFLSEHMARAKFASGKARVSLLLRLLAFGHRVRSFSFRKSVW